MTTMLETTITRTTTFKQACVQTQCAGVSLWLHHERVVYWPERKTLLVADVHLGKEHVFSRTGSAIPTGPSEGDIARLSNLVQSSRAEIMIKLTGSSYSIVELSGIPNHCTKTSLYSSTNREKIIVVIFSVGTFIHVID